MWTYDPEMPTKKDEVRLMVGDTTLADPLVQDEEIEKALEYYPAVSGKPAYLAAAFVCDTIVMKLARSIDKSLGELSLSNAQKFDHYKDLAQSLRIAYMTNGVGVPDPGIRRVPFVAPILGGGGPTVLGSV